MAPRYQFCILYDTGDMEQADSLKQLADKILKELQTATFRGSVPHNNSQTRDCHRTSEVCKLADECHYVIPIITVRQDNSLSDIIDHIKLARQMKMKQGHCDRVLPVFYKVKEEDIKDLLHDEGLLGSLNLTDFVEVDVGDEHDEWLRKLKQVVGK